MLSLKYELERDQIFDEIAVKEEEITLNHAEWRISNGQRFLRIYASDRYTVGYLQGKYLCDQIKYLKKIMKFLSLRFLFRKYNYDYIVKLAKKYEKFIPSPYKVEMQGMADAVEDLEYEDILAQNCFLDILYGRLIPKHPAKEKIRNFDLGCTSFGMIMDEIPLLAQNFDLSFFFKPTLAFVHLIMPGKFNIFSLRLGSLLSLPMGMNENLSLRVNVVKTKNKGYYSLPCSVKSRIALEKYHDAELCSKFMVEKRRSASNNLLISDSRDLISLEMLPKQ